MKSLCVRKILSLLTAVLLVISAFPALFQAFAQSANEDNMANTGLSVGYSDDAVTVRAFAPPIHPIASLEDTTLELELVNRPEPWEASPGDILEYRITFTNNSAVYLGVYIQGDIPQGTVYYGYDSVTDISGWWVPHCIMYGLIDTFWVPIIQLLPEDVEAFICEFSIPPEETFTIHLKVVVTNEVEDRDVIDTVVKAYLHGVSDEITSNAVKTAVAVPPAPEYTVRFIDSIDGREIARETVEEGNTAKQPEDPLHSGYSFTGWYMNPLGEGTPWDASTPIFHDITVYACWEPDVPVERKEYTVRFIDSIDGREIAREAVEEGNTAKQPEDPLHSGYFFTGWYMNPLGEGTPWDASTPIFHDITVYACWEPDIPVERKEYTVRFIDSIDGREIARETVEEGDTVARPKAPVHLGYSFTDWYGDKELENQYDFNSKISSNTDIYAAWKEDPDGKDDDGKDNGEKDNNGGKDNGEKDDNDEKDNNGGKDKDPGSDKRDDLDGGGVNKTGGNKDRDRKVAVGRDIHINDIDVPLANELLSILEEDVPLSELSIFDIPDTGITRGCVGLIATGALFLAMLVYKREE